MAQRIFKYPLAVLPREMIQMPIGARILSVCEQNEMPVLYALVDDEQPHEPVIIRIATTGEVFNPEGCSFVGSLIMKGWFVAHVWHQDGDAPDPVSPRFAEDFKDINEEVAKR